MHPLHQSTRTEKQEAGAWEQRTNASPEANRTLPSTQQGLKGRLGDTRGQRFGFGRTELSRRGENTQKRAKKKGTEQRARRDDQVQVRQKDASEDGASWRAVRAGTRCGHADTEPHQQARSQPLPKHSWARGKSPAMSEVRAVVPSCPSPRGCPGQAGGAFPLTQAQSFVQRKRLGLSE